MNPEALRIESDLKYGDGKNFEANSSLLTDLLALDPAEAQPSLSLLANRWRAGTFVINTGRLVDLCERFKDPALLESMRARGTLNELGTWDECRIYTAGVADVEPRLLTYLWQNWRDSYRPERPTVVSALGSSGGQEALNVLTAILPELAGSIPEKAVEAERDDSANPLAPVELRVDEAFLYSVRSAITKIRQRLTRAS
jgi:hypothetical protein